MHVCVFVCPSHVLSKPSLDPSLNIAHIHTYVYVCVCVRVPSILEDSLDPSVSVNTYIKCVCLCVRPIYSARQQSRHREHIHTYMYRGAPAGVWSHRRKGQPTTTVFFFFFAVILQFLLCDDFLLAAIDYIENKGSAAITFSLIETFDSNR